GTEHLVAASVIGHEVPLALWMTITRTDEQTLMPIIERATRARLLEETPDGTGVRFVHALIREAGDEGASPVGRRARHQKIGEVSAASPNPDPDAVAYHFRQAGDARAVEWLVRAGDRARRLYAYANAAERYRTALALLGDRDADAQEHGWLIYRLARTDYAAPPHQRLAYFDEALQRAAEGDDRLLAAETHYRRATYRCNLGDPGEGLAEMAIAVETLETLPDSDRARLAAYWDTIRLPPEHRAHFAAYLALAGRYAEALAHAERAITDTASPPGRQL